jgi:hypothetical protein
MSPRKYPALTPWIYFGMSDAWLLASCDGFGQYSQPRNLCLFMVVYCVNDGAVMRAWGIDQKVWCSITFMVTLR